MEDYLALAWPPFGLKIHTPRLELRMPTCIDIVRLAPVSYHAAPATRRIGASFTAPELLAREQARSIAEWSVERWTLNFGVFLHSGEPVGLQGLAAERYPTKRCFETPAWVTPQRRRQKFATEMRGGVLSLTFNFLGAASALASPLADNVASIGVSLRLGYEQNQSMLKRNANMEGAVHLVLSRERWRGRLRTEVKVRGLEACLPLFGLGDNAVRWHPEAPHE
jgi:RimJ/RimL family protein N-acetyltransferase